MLFIMELVWTDLINGWDRVRFFDGAVVNERRTMTFDNLPDPVEIQLLEFGPPTRWELFDAIAVSRLEQSLVQHVIDLNLRSAEKVGVMSFGEGPVPLPGPGNFISVGELIAFHFLEEVLFLPVRENREHAGGLALKHWLRGYAYIAELCREGDQPRSEIKFCTLDELVNGLCRVGFDGDQAHAFVRYVTFGRQSRDLMDDPLVRHGDGNFLIFTPGYRSPALSTIVMSRLGRFQTDFAEKGRRFESSVMNEFTKAGIPARSFKYKAGGVQFDCDVAVLWGRTLFVLECKNHSLAFGHLPSLSNFHQEFYHAADQAARVMRHFEENPELVRNQFGDDAVWDRIVGCVTYATPWSIGPFSKDFNLYSYDASALARFLQVGQIDFYAPRRHEEVTVLRRHRHMLWKSDKPDEEDFLRQLRDPIQLRMERAGRKVEALFRETAPLKGLALPSWKEEPLTPEAVLRSLDMSDKQAAEIAKDFENFHASADKFERREPQRSS